MLVNKENLLNAGYKIYASPTSRNEPHYIESFEKRFDDEHGKKYFIHLDCWDLRSLAKFKKDVDFGAKTQFNNENGETFDVSYFVRTGETTIEDVEKFFENMWVKMECAYYEEFGY